MTYPLQIVSDDISLPEGDELELARAEHEVNQRELQLAGERARLETAAGSILAQLQHVKAAAAQPVIEGLQDPAVAELRRRVQQAQVPGLDVDTVRRRAIQARRAAVESRMQAAEHVRQAVQSHAAALSRLSSQLAADEAELARFEKLARAAAKAQAERARPPPPPAPTPAAVPASSKPQGRRNTPRVRMQAAVDLASDSNFFTGFSTNVSEGGLFIATVTPVAQGTPVELTFSIPGGGKISAHGVVRWTREINDQTPEIFPGVGVQFTGLEPEAAQAIKQFVASREPMFYPD